MPSMDYTINIMSVVNFFMVLVVSIGGWFAFKSRVDTVLTNQKELMDRLTQRFEKHEDQDRELFTAMQAAITRLVGDVSRLIGRYESQPLRRINDSPT